MERHRFGFPTKYLGDGVYASFDGFQIWLELQTGEQIALEPNVLANLISYDSLIRGGQNVARKT